MTRLRHQQSYPPPPEAAPLLPAVVLARPAPWRGISAKVALICVLLAFVGLLAVLGVQRIATLTQQAVVQIADVGRLRMYTKALTLEAVRPQLPESERANRFRSIADKVDLLLATLADDPSFAVVRPPLAVKAAVESLHGVWPEFRELGERIAGGAPADQMFFVSEAEMLGHAEALVGALTEENDRRRALLVEAIMLCLLLGFATTVFVYHLIRRTLITPALELAAASQRLAAGDLSARVPVRRRDEIGMLGRAFNESAARLNEMAHRQRLHEADLRDSEERYRSLWETSTDAIIVMGADNRIEFTNAAAESVFGYPPEALLGRSIEILQPEALRCVHRQAFARHLQPSPPLRSGTVTTQAIHADGRLIDVEMAFSRFELSHGRRVAAFFRDVTERRRAEAALRLRDRALESSSNGILISAIAGNGSGEDLEIVYVNPAFTRITGYTLEDALGRSPLFLIAEDRDQIEIEKVCEAIRHRHPADVLLRNYRKDGELFWNELALAPVENEQGKATHFIAVCDDVTARKRDEQALVFNATHDGLTDLPNRALLIDRLEQAIVSAASHGSQLAVMFLDLDNFKMVNDGLGHAAGDELLVEVARRLAAVVEERHTLARLGGDEFVLLVADIERATPVAQLGARLLEAIGRPIRVAGQDIYVGGSIGVAIYPRDGSTPEGLLKNADIAMYRAKEEGKRNVQFFTEELQERVSRRLSVEGALRRATDNGEFELYFQPQMEIASGRLVGAEALIRWRHPERGLVPPREFIPIAEDSGLIIPIGAWVIDAACREARRWQEDSATAALTMAVNLSPRQFRDRRLLTIIDEALSRHALSAMTLEVELTESMVMHDPEEADGILRRMKECGLTLALDDFGTGYSSLSYLKHFPIDILKIDQSFVRDIPHAADDSEIARAIVSLAHSLGLKVVAEGVEQGAQLNFLASADCDMIQGYLLERPLPGEAFREFVRGYRENLAELGVAK